jgi:hypothetical protein
MPTKKGNKKTAPKKTTTNVAAFIESPRTPLDDIRALADRACGCAIGDEEKSMIELVELVAAEGDPAERARIVNTVKEVAALYTSPDEIRKRAEAIIGDAERYDDETRAAISQLLKEESEDLGVMVARVEHGETILDLTQHDVTGQTDATPEARAGAIIEDYMRYDIDTRLEVRLALQHARFSAQHAELNEERGRDLNALRDKVARAEAGECLADFTGIKPEKVAVARALVELLGMPGDPDFVLNGIMTLLRTVQDKTGAKIWLQTDERYGETGGWSLPILARVCERDEATDIQLEPKHDLAAHIAAVLRHKDTPAALYNAMQDALGELVSPPAVQHSPEVIRVALAAQASTQ